MPYQNPTLFGMVYTSRLFREADVPSSYEELCDRTGPTLNLQNPAHAQAILEWLNKWGCRIEIDLFPRLSQQLAQWDDQWSAHLPQASVELLELASNELDILADAYEALLAVFRTANCRSTPAAKALFAVRPEAAVAWDRKIRSTLNVLDDKEAYREMLALSTRELEMLVVEAMQRGIAKRDIPRFLGSPGRTLVRLLDEYHWITITVGNQVPTCGESQEWISCTS
jgi:hypothetical protein